MPTGGSWNESIVSTVNCDVSRSCSRSVAGEEHLVAACQPTEHQHQRRRGGVDRTAAEGDDDRPARTVPRRRVGDLAVLRDRARSNRAGSPTAIAFPLGHTER